MKHFAQLSHVFQYPFWMMPKTFQAQVFVAKLGRICDSGEFIDANFDESAIIFGATASIELARGDSMAVHGVLIPTLICIK